jgi:hypothetical protein
VQHLGEIIEANTTGFTARCAVLHEPPPFGAFVQTGDGGRPAASEADGPVFALVSFAMTAGLDPGRRPSAFGLSEEELRREQPQVFELLATDFSAITIGHGSPEAVYPYLPPRPPRIHQRVWACTEAQVAALTEGAGFLRAIFARAPAGIGDELAAAAIRHAYQARGGDRDFLVAAGKRVAEILRADFDRVQSVLSKLPPFD